MRTYEELRQLIKENIQSIDAEYKSCYQTYEPTEREKKLIAFFDDVWGTRFQDADKADCLNNASVQLSFIDKDNKLIYCDKNFRLSKLHPKNKKTMPLYYVISRLAQSKEYNLFFCPNIYIKTAGHFQNREQLVSASNCYFVDIDDIQTDKPVYNCSEAEILEYLYSKYEILKKCPPTYILMSGGGLHLYFSLQHTEYLFGNRYHNKARVLHRELTCNLIKILQADPACKNMNRLLRVPFSRNMKYNIPTRFFDYAQHSRKYSYDMLKEMIEPVLSIAKETQTVSCNQTVSYPETVKKTKETKITNTVRNVNTTAEYRSIVASNAKKALFLARRADLELWFNLHMADMRGSRHNFFLVYSIVLKKLHFSDEVLYKKCAMMNDALTEPIPDTELLKILDYPCQYLYRNQTYADLLNFTQAEIAMMSCHYGEDAIAKYRKECSKRNYEIEKAKSHQKQKDKEERIFKIIQENLELPLSRLAVLIGCHKSSAFRWKNKYLESH